MAGAPDPAVASVAVASDAEEGVGDGTGEALAAKAAASFSFFNRSIFRQLHVRAIAWNVLHPEWKHNLRTAINQIARQCNLVRKLTSVAVT